MSPEQVCDVLVVLEVGRADPDLSDQPVILAVSGKEDRGVLSWNLAQLGQTGEQTQIRRFSIEKKQDTLTVAHRHVTCMAKGRILF